jgi:dienelactone hydrolase
VLQADAGKISVSKMRIIVATDIHGVNDVLRKQFSILGQPIIVSPWSGDGCPFATEQDAVAVFHRQNGLASYERKIAEAANGEAALLVGFSVGATSLWRHIASPRCCSMSRAFLYYGSRIRDYPQLRPRCTTSVFFAAHEPSFDPPSLALTIRKSGTQCSVIDGTQHGFMNPCSSHYREDIARAHLSMLLKSQQL